MRWMGGRAVEGTGLENRQTGNRLVGSNPTLSAKSTSGNVRLSAELIDKKQHSS